MYILTEQAVAESVPRACRPAPDPPAFKARNKREVDAENRHQYVTHADVDQQQIRRRPESLESIEEHDHYDVVAKPKHSNAADGQGEKFVGASSKQMVGCCSTPLTTSSLVGRIHCVDNFSGSMVEESGVRTYRVKCREAPSWSIPSAQPIEFKPARLIWTETGSVVQQESRGARAASWAGVLSLVSSSTT